MAFTLGSLAAAGALSFGTVWLFTPHVALGGAEALLEWVQATIAWVEGLRAAFSGDERS